jgi:hypothetical protein
MTIKLLLVSNPCEYKMHPTDFYLCGLHYVSFEHIPISLTCFIVIPNSMRILYNASLLTES